MTHKHFFLICLSVLASALTLTLVSCSSSEPLDIECDVESIQIGGDEWHELFDYESQSIKSVTSFDVSHVEYTQTSFVFQVRAGVKVSSHKTYINVSPNATLYLKDVRGEEIPFESGSLVDYAGGLSRTFVVRSQSKEWKREYKVQLLEQEPEPVIAAGDTIVFLYDFNEGTYHLVGANPTSNNHYVWEENDPLLKTIFNVGDYTWKNGNPGFKLANSSKAPTEYPTVPVFGGGPDGSDCLRLETKSAGKMGVDVGCPNASGSLFNGSFDPRLALKSKSEALKATLFGCPFSHVPVMLEADLKLEHVGTAYDDKDNPFTDEPDMYCVIYDNMNQSFVLDGGNVLTSDKIVGIARLPHLYNGIYDRLTMSPIHGLTEGEWVHVTLPVDYNPWDKSSIDNSKETREKAIDVEKLKKKGYSMVIGASSSWQGGNFNAFVGQSFLIDNIKLTCVDPGGAEDNPGQPGEDNPGEPGGDDDPNQPGDDEPLVLSMLFDNNSALNAAGRYYEWTETDESLTSSLFAKYNVWGTTNHGFSIWRSGQKPDQYPVTPVTRHTGKGVSLKTLDNALMGPVFGKRFTAGLLFLGYEEQVTSPDKISPATLKMGVPFKYKPIKLSAYLKYKAGSKYQNEQGYEQQVTDQPEFFCVVYDNSGNKVLNGTNVLDDQSIVACARLTQTVGSSWTQVELPIEYSSELTAADFATGRYSIVICAASSKGFATYCGAVGSELSIDDVTLEYEK